MRHDARGRGRTFRAVLALPALPAVLAVLAAVAVPLLAGCGGDAGEAGTRNAGTAAGEEAGGEDGGTPGAAAGQPDTVSFHEFGARWRRSTRCSSTAPRACRAARGTAAASAPSPRRSRS